MRTHAIRTALDVGPGRGTYHRILRDLIATMDAVEIWAPYLRRYRLEGKYHKVDVADIRTWDGWGEYDLVIFGDCLEHMTREEAVEVWQRAGESAKFTLMSTPVIPYPQGPLKGNPHEVHVQPDVTPEEIRRDYGPFVLDKVYKVTGTFVRQWW